VLAGLLRRNPRDRLRPDDVRRMLQRVAAADTGRQRGRSRRNKRRVPIDLGPAISPSISADPGGASGSPAPPRAEPGSPSPSPSPSPWPGPGPGSIRPGVPVDGMIMVDPVVAMESAVSAAPTERVDPGNGPTTVLPTSAPPARRDGGPVPPLRTALAPRGRRWVIAGVAGTLVLAVSGALAAAATNQRHGAGNAAGTTWSPRHSASVPAATVVQPDPVLRDTACPTTGASAFTPTSARPGWYGLLAGWQWYRDPGGYRVAAPAGWQVYRGLDGLCFREPDGARVLGVMTWHTSQSPMQHVTARERDIVAQVKPDRYHQIRITPANYYQGAADWEFAFVNGAGVPMHADTRDFLVAPGRGYTIVWCTQNFDWDVNQNYFLMILASFVP
jgi:hypothetical protein